MIIKRLKCEKCGFVKATNKLNDDRFYCPICGKNLGCYIIKEEKLEEKGVWIVYDLEANRKIQKLLLKEKFAFRFDSTLETIRRERNKEILEIIEKGEKEIKVLMNEVKHHNCRKETGNLCLDCEINEAKARGILFVIQKLEEK